MQFFTILQPKIEEYRRRGQTGGLLAPRGSYFNDFAYELHDDPTVEGIAVRFAPGLRGILPREFWPDVEVGARSGAEGARTRGLRLCCVRFTMTLAKYHDVDTTPQAVQRHVASCVDWYVAACQTEPVPPLRAEWLTSDVVALARGIHAKQALDGLPALTDALLEAGCDDPLAIDHLTTCPDHGPMCWVVEMICAQAAARDGTSG
jgi:hypothetical protein